ncbi:MAG: hypothetical protein N3F67_05010 [Acidilobaceae archaeon]|nr:hypothetical protein [Acidilobaceae archaeon]
MVLTATALLSLLSASLFQETLSAPVKVGTGYIDVVVEGAEVEEGGNVCAVNSWKGTTVYVNVSGQAGDRCLIRVRAYNNGTVPARLKSVDPRDARVVGAVELPGPVLPRQQGIVKFSLTLRENLSAQLAVKLNFAMGPP